MGDGYLLYPPTPLSLVGWRHPRSYIFQKFTRNLAFLPKFISNANLSPSYCIETLSLWGQYRSPFGKCKRPDDSNSSGLRNVVLFQAQKTKVFITRSEWDYYSSGRRITSKRCPYGIIYERSTLNHRQQILPKYTLQQ